MAPEVEYGFIGPVYSLYVGSGDVRFGGYLYCDGATNLFYFDNTLNIPGVNVRDGGTVNIGLTGTSTPMVVRGKVTIHDGIQLQSGDLTVVSTQEASLGDTLGSIRTQGGIYAAKQIRTATDVLAVGVKASGGITQGTGTPTTTPVNYFTGSVEFAGAVTCTGDLSIAGVLTIPNISATTITSLQTTELAKDSGTTTIGSSTKAQFSAAGVLSLLNTTDSSTVNSNASLTTQGGIYAAKQIRTATDVLAVGVQATGSITTSSNSSGFRQGTVVPPGSPVNYFTSTTQIAALLTCTAGLTVSSGATSLQALQVANSTTSYFGSSTGAAVGINTSTPQRPLHIVGGLARIDREVSQGSGGGCYFVSLNSGAIVGAWSMQSGTSTSTPNFTIAYTNAAAGGGATITPITVTTAGLTTLTSLSVSGSSTVQNLTVNGTLTYSGTITTTGGASFSTLASSAATTLATSSGTTTIGSSTAAQFSAAGALTLQNRLTINSGGVSGSTNTGISISGNNSTTKTNWDQQNENAPNIYEVFSGDLTLRSFWGVSVNLNSGAVNPSGNAGQARITNTSCFTVNRRAVGAGSGVYDNVFSVNGISGLTTVQGLSGTTGTFSSTLAAGATSITGTLSCTTGATLCSSSGTCTIGSSTALTVSAAGILTVNNTTASTGLTNGCAIFNGGIAVQGTVFANNLRTATGGSVVTDSVWCRNYYFISSTSSQTIAANLIRASSAVVREGMILSTPADTWDTATNFENTFGLTSVVSVFVTNNSPSYSYVINAGSGWTYSGGTPPTIPVNKACLFYFVMAARVIYYCYFDS